MNKEKGYVGYTIVEDNDLTELRLPRWIIDNILAKVDTFKEVKK